MLCRLLRCAWGDGDFRVKRAVALCKRAGHGSSKEDLKFVFVVEAIMRER